MFFKDLIDLSAIIGNHDNYSIKYIRITTIFIYCYINNKKCIGILPVVLNSPSASSSLINLKFWLSHTIHIDENIVFSFFVLTTFELLLFVFFYKEIKIFYEVPKLLDFLFLLSCHHILLIHHLLKQTHDD